MHYFKGIGELTVFKNKENPYTKYVSTNQISQLSSDSLVPPATPPPT